MVSFPPTLFPTIQRSGWKAIYAAPRSTLASPRRARAPKRRRPGFNPHHVGTASSWAQRRSAGCLVRFDAPCDGGVPDHRRNDGRMGCAGLSHPLYTGGTVARCGGDWLLGRRDPVVYSRLSTGDALHQCMATQEHPIAHPKRQGRWAGARVAATGGQPRRRRHAPCPSIRHETPNWPLEWTPAGTGFLDGLFAELPRTTV